MRGSAGGASPAALAAWQQRTFPALRPKPTPFLDELPDDLLADVEASRAAIDRARRALRRAGRDRLSSDGHHEQAD